MRWISLFFFPPSLRDKISFKETQVLFWVIEQLQSYTSLSSLPNHLWIALKHTLSPFIRIYIYYKTDLLLYVQAMVYFPWLNNNITRNLEIRLSFGKYGPKEHKGYTYIHFPSFCSGTTWHEKKSAIYGASHSKYSMFLTICHPQLSCNHILFHEMPTLNSRAWFSLHTYTNCKLWAASGSSKVKFSTLITLFKLIIWQCRRQNNKYKPYLLTEYIDFIYW